MSSSNYNSKSYQSNCQAFASLFKGRTDAWYSPMEKKVDGLVTLDHYERHLNGDTPLGIYPIRQDNTCCFATIDIDRKDFSEAKTIRDTLNPIGLFCYISESQSKGYHIDLFFQEPTIAKDIRRILYHILDPLQIDVEVFPKQDTLSKVTPYGSAVNLPCFGCTRPFIGITKKEGYPHSVELEYVLAHIKRIPAETIDELLKEIPEPPPIKAKKPRQRGRPTVIPYCVEKMLDGVEDGKRDITAFTLARYYLTNKYQPGEVLSILRDWDTRNEPPVEDDRWVETKVRSAEKYDFGCGTIQKEPKLAKFCNQEECDWLREVKKIKDEKKQLLARFPGLVDLVDKDDEVSYLMADKNGKFTVVAETSMSEVPVIPPEPKHLPFCLPRASEVLKYISSDSDSQLFNDLISYFKKVAELPTDKHYMLIALWTMHTYFYEYFNYSPILAPIGLPVRGKSRLGRGITAIAYRGVETETMREANLFRWSQDLGATIFLDVKDIWRKAVREKSEDILLKRYEKGGKAARVLYPERGPFKDTVYFDIYGPTIIATNEAIQLILDTRCIPILMPKSKQMSWLELNPEEQLTLKERLVAFRARHMNEALPDYPKPALERLGDILKPLGVIMLLVSPENGENFKELTKLLWSERMEDKSQSKEARLILVVEMTVKIAGEKDMVGNDIVAISEVTKIYNETLGLKDPVRPESIGYRLKRLGFKRTRSKTGDRAIIVDHELLQGLKAEWGVDQDKVDRDEKEN